MTRSWLVLEELPRGAIQEAIAAGEITSDEMVDMFRSTLRDLLGGAES